MAQYLDMTKAEGCIGLIPKNGDTLVLTGVSINAMPLSVKRKEGDVYAQFARDYDISFIFEDDIPPVDFYSVPRIDIAATDSAGGYIASVGEHFSLCHSVPLVYISQENKCYFITEDSTKFLSLAPRWKKVLTPYDGVTLYASKAAAKKELHIEDVENLPEYQQLLKLIEQQQSNLST